MAFERWVERWRKLDEQAGEHQALIGLLPARLMSLCHRH